LKNSSGKADIDAIPRHLMFPSIHDAVQARDHSLCFVIKKTATRKKARSDISFEGGEEEIEDMIEDPSV